MSFGVCHALRRESTPEVVERAPDEHNRVRNVSFSGSQDVGANARAFDPGDGVFDDDALT